MKMNNDKRSSKAEKKERRKKNFGIWQRNVEKLIIPEVGDKHSNNGRHETSIIVVTIREEKVFFSEAKCVLKEDYSTSQESEHSLFIPFHLN